MWLKICFFALFGFLHNAYAMDGVCGMNPCNKEFIKSSLIDLGLNSTIVNNGSLLANIQLEYSEFFVDELVNKHPSLKNPAGIIDTKTLKWIKEIGFSNKYSVGINYIVSPFITSANDYGANVFLRSWISELYPTIRTVPVFLSNEQLMAIRDLYYENDFELPILKLKKYFKLDKGTATALAKKVYYETFINEKYIIGNDIKKIGKHKVSIAGHGVNNPNGSDVISDTDIVVRFDEVVNILKKSGIPHDVDLELLVCSGALMKSIPGKTKEELKNIFINRTIDEYTGDYKKSFGYKFSNYLYFNWAEFTGLVFAYKGSYILNMGPTYYRDPHDEKKLLSKYINSVSWKDINGDRIRFDRAELRAEYKRSDFIGN